MAYQSRKKKKRKEFRVRFRVWGFLALIVTLFGAAYYFSRYESWTFTEVVFTGDERVDVGQIEEQIWKELESPWYVLFAQNNRWFFPKERITNSVLEASPLMKGMSITLEKNKSLTVTIEERGPQYIVCDQAIQFELLTPEQKSLQCAFVDYNGLAYEMYDGSVANNALFVEQNTQNIRVPLVFFDDEEVRYLRGITMGLGGIPVSKIIFQPTQSTDVYLNDTFHIKFTELVSLTDQFQNIEIALSRTIAEIPLGEYLYIDARFPGELYVRELTEEDYVVQEEFLKDEAMESVDNEEEEA